jgi:hypothetical protein
MENAPLETMTMQQLQQLCKDEQIPAYGTKQQMIERIKEKALTAITSDSAPVIQEAKAEANMEVSKLIAASDADVKQFGLVTKHKDMVNSVIDEVRSKYPRIAISYQQGDSDDGVYVLEGGRQGRVTTTANQPAKAVMSVVNSYHNVMTSGMRTDFGNIGGNSDYS